MLQAGGWPAGAASLSEAQAAVAKLCDANRSCAAFGLFSAARAYQLYPRSPTTLRPLPTPDWTYFYRNATCCAPPAPPPPVRPSLQSSAR